MAKKQDPKIINKRFFLHNLKKCEDEGGTFIITNHGKKEWAFVPYAEYEKNLKKKEPLYLTREELESYAVSDPNVDPDLSKKVDEIYDL